MQRMDKKTGELADRTIKITQSQQQSRLGKKINRTSETCGTVTNNLTSVSSGGLHPFLPLQLFPPAHWSLVPGPSRRRFPLSRPGPLGLARLPGPTHFLCRFNSAPTWGGKFLSSRWAAASPSFPAGQESPKRVGRLVGLQASSQRGEVTRPQSHNRETTPSQLGTMGWQLCPGTDVSHPAAAEPLQTRGLGRHPLAERGAASVRITAIFPPQSQAVRTHQC